MKLKMNWPRISLYKVTDENNKIVLNIYRRSIDFGLSKIFLFVVIKLKKNLKRAYCEVLQLKF